MSKRYEEQTQRSINIGLQIASFADYYKKCEHSDFPSTQEILNRASKIEDANIFYEEIKSQKDARENYSNYFYICKTKDENNSAVAKKLQWFEYMVEKYAANEKGNNPPDKKLPATLKLASGNRSEKVVDCILALYKGVEFLADGLRNTDGGITVQLLAPVLKPLAVVTDIPSGSTTEFLNIKNIDNRAIPQPDTFDSAVGKCQ